MCLIIISLIGLIYRIKRKKEKQRIYHIIGNCVDSDCDYLDFVLISVFSGALLMGLVLKIQNIFGSIIFLVGFEDTAESNAVSC